MRPIKKCNATVAGQQASGQEISSNLPNVELNTAVEQIDVLAVSVREFCRRTSLGRTTAFQLARDGAIETRKVRGRTLILMRSVEALLQLQRSEKAAQ